MFLRFLFGPVSASFADQHLHTFRQAGHCLAFDGVPGTDVTIGPADHWEKICRQFPNGWQPDIIVLYLPYTTIPESLCSAPVPLVGLAADWNWQWHSFRHRLKRCERILTDTLGVTTLCQAGFSQARPAVLYGLGRDFLSTPWAENYRDRQCQGCHRDLRASDRG